MAASWRSSLRLETSGSVTSVAKSLYDQTLDRLRKDNSRGRFQLPNYHYGTPCMCGCGQTKTNCFEGQNLENGWYASGHSPRPTNEVTARHSSPLTGSSFPIVLPPSEPEPVWVHKSQVEISTPEIPALSQEELRDSIEKRVASTFERPRCSECSGRLDSKPIGCISRAHLMSYEKSREKARLRQSRHRARQ